MKFLPAPTPQKGSFCDNSIINYVLRNLKDLHQVMSESTYKNRLDVHCPGEEAFRCINDP